MDEWMIQTLGVALGLVLTLMTLPTIIIAGRAAVQAVPPSIRDAALGVGASKMQTIMHHVLPLAMPGMLTVYSFSATTEIAPASDKPFAFRTSCRRTPSNTAASVRHGVVVSSRKVGNSSSSAGL